MFYFWSYFVFRLSCEKIHFLRLENFKNSVCVLVSPSLLEILFGDHKVIYFFKGLLNLRCLSNCITETPRKKSILKQCSKLPQRKQIQCHLGIHQTHKLHYMILSNTVTGDCKRSNQICRIFFGFESKLMDIASSQYHQH